jgi:hypothetical protein
MSALRRTAALIVALLCLLVGLGAAAAASSARPYHHHPVLRCQPFKPAVGSQITVVGEDFQANDHVVVALHSKVTDLGSVDANANGNFQKVFQLPAGVRGPHTIVATGQGGAADADVAKCQLNIGASGTGGGGDHNPSGGGTSGTGVAVASFGILGLGLIVGGTLFVLSARKRRAAETD